MRSVRVGSETLESLLAEKLSAVAKGNSHTTAPAAAVLWPDKERQWVAAIPTLKQSMPGLCELGTFAPCIAQRPCYLAQVCNCRAYP
jgi:hypothetical protein